MAQQSRGWMIMNFAGEKTVRELERDHEECEGCGSRKKPVYTYLGKDNEPIVCSVKCFNLAIVKRFGGVRKPTKQQLADDRAHKNARRLKQTSTAQIIPLRNRKTG